MVSCAIISPILSKLPNYHLGNLPRAWEFVKCWGRKNAASNYKALFLGRFTKVHQLEPYWTLKITQNWVRGVYIPREMETQIAKWLNALIGPGRRFRSPRAMSRDAGLSQNTVLNILRSGAGDAESIGKLADLLGMPRMEAFVLAGWLKPTDLVRAPTDTEANLLLDFGRLPGERKVILLEVLAGFLTPTNQ